MTNSSNKSVKILHVLRQADFGGGETYVRNLVKHLDKKRYDAVFLSFKDGPLIDELWEAGIKCYVLESPRILDFKQTLKIIRIIEQEEITLLHAHGTKAAGKSLLPALFCMVPIIYTIHSWSWHPGVSKFGAWFRKMVERILAKYVHTSICVSHADNRIGREHLGIRTCRVVQNAVPRDKPLALTSRKKETIRTMLGYQQDDFVVLFLARVTQQKDPLTLLEAFYAFSLRKPMAKLLFVGDGEMKPSVIKRANELGIANLVKFLPATESPAYYRAAADVFVLPSLWEGLSLALMESMHEGLPVIASNLPSNRELIHHGKNGLIFKTGNIDELTDCLLYAYRFPAQLARFSLEAKRTIAASFGINRLIADYDKIYREFAS